MSLMDEILYSNKKEHLVNRKRLFTDAERKVIMENHEREREARVLKEKKGYVNKYPKLKDVPYFWDEKEKVFVETQKIEKRE